MNSRTWIAWMIGLALLVMGRTQAEEAAKAAGMATEVPVTRVVLFSSGVGYFEHNGTVEGDATTALSFKTEQINDMLKSMVVMDDAGTVTSINYASRDPLIRALRSFAVDVSGEPSLGDLLRQLRGAQVELTAPDRIVGKILGVEKVEKTVVTGGTTTIITDVVLNVLTDVGVKAVSLANVQVLKLADEKLDAELRKALDLLVTSRDTERRQVEIHFTGKGKRAVRIGYVTETPVWKTSYRLELSGEKPLLQGWAILENTSDNDWSKVSLALVSGRPMSFVQDLYTPLYAARPVVVPELYASLRPQNYDEGMPQDQLKLTKLQSEQAPPMEKKAADRAYLRKSFAEAKGEASARAAMPMNQRAADYAEREVGGDMDMAHGVQSVASAAKIGELFNFTIKSPVDLPRRRSAMMPIINGGVKAEKVSIYNAAVLPKNPLNGVILINDTGMKLLGGPVTVFDGHMYAGDAQIDNMGTDEKRLLSYAIDLNMSVDASQTTSSQMASAKITRGVLEVRNLTRYVQTYKINNKDDVKRTVIVEHPFYAMRTLVEPNTSEEKTATLYRFRVPVEKKTVGEFVVKEEQVGPVTIGILDRSVGELMFYTNSQDVPQKVRDALAKAIGLKNEQSKLEETLRDKQGQKQAIEAGQDRLRRNIESVGRDSNAGKDYVAKLVAQEKEIEALDGAIKELQAQIATKRNELAEYLKELNVE